MSKKLRKPAPYLVQQDSYSNAQAAQWVRNKFKPLMAKRLPNYLYGGFKHGYVVDYVQKHKLEYGHFLKVDIAKFYPNISHHHLTVETQLAYKKLLGFHYVPQSFKHHLLPELDEWFASLPTDAVGIPLNSAMSKALAPLMLVPFF